MLNRVKILRKDYEKALCTVIVKTKVFSLTNVKSVKTLYDYSIIEFKSQKEANAFAKANDGFIEEIITVNNVGYDVVESIDSDPNDGQLYSYSQSRVLEAHRDFEGSDGEGLIIGVNDTPFNRTHEDLDAIITKGFNPYEEGDVFEYQHFHGTHVLGTIAAENNEKNITGVLPKAKAYVTSGLTKDGWGYGHKLAEANEWLRTNKVKFSNHSYGPGTHPLLIEAFNKMYEDGLIVVVAAGNNNEPVTGMAALDSVVTVVSTDKYDQKSSFSNYGPETDLSAPGSSILSLSSTGGVRVASGTSMAAPFVMACLASLWNYANINFNEDLTKEELVAIFNKTGVKIEGIPPRIDFYKALEYYKSTKEDDFFEPSINTYKYDAKTNKIVIGIEYKKNTITLESFNPNDGIALYKELKERNWKVDTSNNQRKIVFDV